MSKINQGRGLFRLGVVVVVLWVGYWGYEAVEAGKLWFSLSDTFGADSGVARTAYAEREFAKKMALAGPVVALAALIIGRWLFRGFRADT